MGSTAQNQDDDIQVKDDAAQVEEDRKNGDGTSHGETLSKTEGVVQNGDPANKWVKILEEAAEKSGDVLKTSALKVGDFATHATHIAKLKLEAHKLNNELGKLILEMGHKLWELHKSQSLHEVEDAFLEDFKNIEAIEEKLEENQNQMQS